MNASAIYEILMAVGACLLIVSIIGLVRTRKASGRTISPDSRRLLWLDLVIGIFLILLPCLILILAVITI